MHKLALAYDRLITYLAVFGGLIVVALVVVIVTAVTIRAVGGQPPEWSSTFAEYALLYMTLLSAPWLVRERANVIVDTLVNVLPPPARRGLERLTCALCCGLAVVISVFGAKLTIASIKSGDLDIRSVAVPYWIFRIIVPIGFSLIAVEFARQLFSSRIADGRDTDQGGL